ncbi:4-(cytidine 5'-diphospho)-2-C-methyl-D-erythritol kinase [Roseivivax isoporae]|uniref:4-diphosphocytidyl-2-C-methyl-D-erythritol kinase n=1 Tax=Roseivivax isoporae LMG 25204 TaxID=1449351 RepID=X7FER2_9RHOB|nr:4-(cytidine 5'-diphospho)-2-C-methyl-D-erythritol kinase [Roseivivax isoporae]ETX30526.1 4-diphosphocytidyl-2C-methyl-D-erythritol kinase [Roseivivax isoporae LMG 25204]
MIEAFAPAKINLTLHVTGQRPDGYHALDSLVVFADVGDSVRVAPADALSLRVTGPRADGVPDGPENLVQKAARLLDPVRGAEIVLDKRLPTAAGLGGGSSDAAATLRALSELWGVPVPRNAMILGADVPMCLAPGAQRISGAGEGTMPVELPELPAVLVNPGMELSTPAVYGALETKENPPMPEVVPTFGDAADCARWLAEQRNDLGPPARGLAPVVGEVLAALSDAMLARMSGSGATCFGLYADAAAARRAADRIAAAEPGWWVAAVTLNGADMAASFGEDQFTRATT